MDLIAVTKEMMTDAEIYHGDETCREKLSLLLSELGLPSRLVAAPEAFEEYGFVPRIDLIWVKLRNRTEQRAVDNIVMSYDTVVSAYVEPRKIRRLTGVRAKEFLIWVKLSEIRVVDPREDDHGFGFITFKTPVGLSRSFPVSLLEPEDDNVIRFPN